LEEKFRLKIFMENKGKIARHNKKAHRGEVSFFMKMNHFGDQVSLNSLELFPAKTNLTDYICSVASRSGFPKKWVQDGFEEKECQTFWCNFHCA